MKAPDDQTFFEGIVGGAWALIVTLFGFIHQGNRSELRNLKVRVEEMMTREEFSKHEAREAEDREEGRRITQAIFQRMAELDTKVDQKLDLIIGHLLGDKR